MADHGGFEHNLQSLRVVDRLEVRYPDFDGLNLCFETREGILKHCSRHNAEHLVRAEPEGPARRFIEGTRPSLEAQLVNLVDEIAYNAHDIDDGLRSGLITMDELAEVPLFTHWRDDVLDQHPALAAAPGKRLVFETLRRLLSAEMGDLITTTSRTLADAAPADADAARRLPPLVGLSAELRERNAVLKRFLFSRLYRHAQVVQSTHLAKQVITDLFRAYVDQTAEMPADFANTRDLPRSVADYIAGMTDRYALREHHRLTGRRLFS
jgi:dGTPase